MRRITSICMAAALLSSTISGSAAVINFDELAGGPIFFGELVLNQYQTLGVTFSDSFSGGAHANNAVGTTIAGSSLPNVLWVDQGSGSASGTFLQISFATFTQHVEALFGTSLNADITMNAFNGATLLDSVTRVGATTIADIQSGIIGVTAEQGITSVQLFSSKQGSENSLNFGIDNLTFGAVPEPGTYVLFIAGLMLISVAASRRSRARH